MNTHLAKTLNDAFSRLTLRERLALLRQKLEGRLVFTTSFGLEDQIITHEIFTAELDIAVVTLDTGRLFPETYQLWASTEERYGRRIRALYPQTQALEDLIADQGIDGFYHAPELRKACCEVRKVEPLARALAGAQGWITGLRGDQSSHRGGLDFVSVDATRDLLKANPLFDWSRDQALDTASQYNVPINLLHGQGFLSIGCAPCTRAIKAGEPERAGRWWWESDTKKECGLHVGSAPSQRLSV